MIRITFPTVSLLRSVFSAKENSTLILVDSFDVIPCGLVGHSFRQVGVLGRSSLSTVLDSVGTFAAGMKRAMFSEVSTLLTLRDGTTLFTDIEQWSIIVSAIGRTMTPNAVVARTVSWEIVRVYHANLYSTLVTGSV